MNVCTLRVLSYPEGKLKNFSMKILNLFTIFSCGVEPIPESKYDKKVWKAEKGILTLRVIDFIRI